ncbi:MAG: ASCH domain-containing protein [Phycisphaerae bacterium]
MTEHLVILKKQYLDAVLHGRKTAECRLSRYRRPPYGVVAVGDRLWLKQSSGPIRGTATVSRVEYFHPLPEARLTYLRRRYSASLQADPTFFDNYQHARYATLIHIREVRPIEPVRLNRSGRYAWIVLAASPVPPNGHLQRHPQESTRRNPVRPPLSPPPSSSTRRNSTQGVTRLQVKNDENARRDG